MSESWELLVRGSVNHYGTSVPGPSKAAAKAVEFCQWAAWTLYYKVLIDQSHGAFQYLFYWKTPLFSSEILLYKMNVLIFLGGTLLIFLHKTDYNRNFCIADLIQCTNEMNVNIPQLADSLFERTTNSSWVVVFKSLITTHHLMVYGNEVIQKWCVWEWGVASPHFCKRQLNASTNSFCKTVFGFAFLGPTLPEHRSHFLFVSIVSTSKCAVLNAEVLFFFFCIHILMMKEKTQEKLTHTGF